jgi:hypothetical protein
VRFAWTSVTGLLLAALVVAAADDYASMQRKLDQIDADKAPRGGRVVFTLRELNAWAAHEVPEGVRNPKLVLGQGTATGTALVDFLKVRKAQGYKPGWLISTLLNGERPVTVTVAIHSGQGTATVDVKRADIGGISVDGSTLDFLIQNFVIPMYPDVAIGRPFELGHGVDRADVAAGGVTLAIAK